jgi:transcriptional regulator with XRE-family HTH domain
MRRLAGEVGKHGKFCDSGYISNLENGVRAGHVHLETARAFGRALKVNPAYLMGLSDDPVPPRDPALKKKA